MEVFVVSALLLVTIILLVAEILPVDLTAIGLMVLLMVTGLLTPAEAVAGFANPAPLTVGALFIASRGLVRTGSLAYFSKHLVAVGRRSPRVMWLMIMGLVGVLSAFVNNTPVVVMFTSIVMSVTCCLRMSPSKLLLPISFMSILAGTSTLIGTSTNIIVSDLSHELGGRVIGMFELSSLGVPLALAGGAFLLFFSERLLPAHKEPVCEMELGQASRYISELRVPASSPLVGADPQKISKAPDLEVFEVIRGTASLDPARGGVALAEDDELLVKATATDLMELVDRDHLELVRGGDQGAARALDERSVIVELLVPPTSALVGQHLVDTHLGRAMGSKIFGVKHRDMHYTEQATRNVRLSVGDILLAQCTTDRIDRLRGSGDLIILEDISQSIVVRRKAPVALAIFLLMVVAAATGLADILACALTAAFLMILTGCLRPQEAYRSMDVKVLLLIIGTIALARALRQTGAADIYARVFISLLSDGGPQMVLAGFVVLTSLLSHFLSNNSTAVLLVPIAFSTAQALGIDPQPLIVGICFGASACYASPIGYQTNLLVYGPGGYRFVDYLRVGLPLNLMVWLVASVAIPWFWPFG